MGGLVKRTRKGRMRKMTFIKLLTYAIFISKSRKAVIKSGFKTVINKDKYRYEKRPIISIDRGIPEVELLENEVEIGRALDDSIIYVTIKQ